MTYYDTPEGWLEEVVNISPQLRDVLKLGFPTTREALLDQLAENLGFDTSIQFPDGVLDLLDAMIQPIETLLESGWALLDQRPKHIADTAVADLRLDALSEVCLHLNLRFTFPPDTTMLDLLTVARSRTSSALSSRIQRMILRWEKRATPSTPRDDRRDKRLNPN